MGVTSNHNDTGDDSHASRPSNFSTARKRRPFQPNLPLYPPEMNRGHLPAFIESSSASNSSGRSRRTTLTLGCIRGGIRSFGRSIFRRDVVLLFLGTSFSLILLVCMFGALWMPQVRNLSWSSSVLMDGGDFFAEDPSTRLPILVIGGTDGSGTRAFVDTLKELRVPILADDPYTFDLHGSIMFAKQGWPALISTLLPHTNGSANYEWEDLPEDTQIIVEREIRKLLKSISARYNDMRRRDRLLGQGGNQVSTNVAFAIKAPVSMLVLPVLTKFMGKLKFVHVLRDGRDISLSHNQSPVLKFYNYTYHDYEARTQQWKDELYPVRAMQLWNDWNLQVRAWASVQTLQTVEYLAMRSEDLLSPDTRYQCLQALAEYVESSLQDHMLCCQSRKHAKDFGASSVHSETQNNFAAHPERWQQLGSGKTKQRGRKPVWMKELESHRNGGPFAGRKLSQQHAKHKWTGNHLAMEGWQGRRLQTFLEASFHQHDPYPEHWNASSHERLDSWTFSKASVDGSEVSIKQQNERRLSRDLEGELLDRNPGDFGRKRRRKLRESPDMSTAKLMPRQFLKQFSQWKQSVDANADGHQVETLHKLLLYGKGLGEQWRLNSEALVDIIDVQEIHNTCERLEMLIQEKGGNKSVENDNTRLAKVDRTNVHERYGKWKTLLENRADLSGWLHKEGKLGLEIFGYEPRVKWAYPANSTFQCNEQVICGVHGTTRRAPLKHRGGVP